MAEQSAIRILCVDDHHLVRDGLALIINRQADLKVVATAATGEQAIALFRQHHPLMVGNCRSTTDTSGQDDDARIWRLRPHDANRLQPATERMSAINTARRHGLIRVP